MLIWRNNWLKRTAPNKVKSGMWIRLNTKNNVRERTVKNTRIMIISKLCVWYVVKSSYIFRQRISLNHDNNSAVGMLTLQDINMSFIHMFNTFMEKPYKTTHSTYTSYGFFSLNIITPSCLKNAWQPIDNQIFRFIDCRIHNSDGRTGGKKRFRKAISEWMCGRNIRWHAAV